MLLAASPGPLWTADEKEPHPFPFQSVVFRFKKRHIMTRRQDGTSRRPGVPGGCLLDAVTGPPYCTVIALMTTGVTGASWWLPC